MLSPLQTVATLMWNVFQFTVRLKLKATHCLTDQGFKKNESRDNDISCLKNNNKKNNIF